MIKHPKYPNGNVYLSGGMQFAADEGAGWREVLSRRLKELGYFPIDIFALDQAYANKYGHFLRGINKDQSHLQRKSNVRKHFIKTDIALVKNDSDAVIAFYDEAFRRGAGSFSECHEAYVNDIPIFLVSDFMDVDKEVPGWLQAMTTKIFYNFDQLCEYMRDLPPGVIKRDIYGNHHVGDYYLCSLSGEVFKKTDLHFVSKVSPLYSKESVEAVRQTNEEHVDRYEFIIQHLENQARIEMLEEEMEHNIRTGRFK